jgi:N-acetylglutamate synthase-like GNAT family acetyltransferase
MTVVALKQRNNTTIRRLRNDDISACQEIVRTNWNDEIALRFREEVDHVLTNMAWPPIYFVAEEDGVIVGFAGMMESWLMEGVWDFIWINVHIDHHGKGIGKALTKHRINEVIFRGGAAIHLMTRQPEYFEQFDFAISHSYVGGWYLMIRQFRELRI